MNGVVRGIRNEFFMQKPFITFGMLAGGHRHNTKYKNVIVNQNNYDSKNLIEKNIIFFLKLSKNTNFKYSISSSSKKNYIDLINTIQSIDKSYNLLDDKIQFDELIDFFKYETCSSYGLKYNKFYNKLFFNKKRVIHEIISLIPLINLSKKWL